MQYSGVRLVYPAEPESGIDDTGNVSTDLTNTSLAKISTMNTVKSRTKVRIVLYKLFVECYEERGYVQIATVSANTLTVRVTVDSIVIQNNSYFSSYYPMNTQLLSLSW